MYQSPIEIFQTEIDDIYKKMKDDFDNNIIEVVHQCCIHVDKDELIKALNYDADGSLYKE